MMRTLVVTLVSSLLTAIAFGETIATNDGLVIDYDGHAITALQLDGHDVPLREHRTMLRVRDASKRGGFADSLPDLELQASLAKSGDRLELSGTVIDRSGKDRCIDLWVGLPIKTDGFSLGTGLMPPKYAAEPKRSRARGTDIDESDSTDDARYPIFPASNTSDHVGLSLAIPPSMPTRFNGGLDDIGVGIVIRIGLSPDTNPPSQTKFSVLVYRHDPARGFRSSLSRYYEFFREPYFTRRAKKIGAWTTQNASLLREKDLYAFHEAGFATWRRPEPTGTGVNAKTSLEHVDEGPACSSLEEFERLSELADDRRLGVYALPYTIVGQRQFLELPELPKTHDEAMTVLKTWSTTQPILFDGPPQAGSFPSGDALKAIIRNSGIYDEQHQLAILPRPYRGPTLTFPQNPNPKLYDDKPDQLTIAKYELDSYLPMLFTSKLIDGCYVDSLGRWCGYYNYRADHFRYSTLPLTYAGSPPQPCIWNLQSHAEYLTELSSRLHRMNKIVFANGVHPNRVMLGFGVDAMGGEGTPTIDGGEAFAALRVAAGIKPYCLLNATGKSSPKLWASALYMGYLLNCNTDAGAPMMRKYLPTIIRMNQVSWQPVTHARSTDENVGIERWGGESEKPLYFSVMNLSKDAANPEVRVDARALKLDQTPTAVDAISGETITGRADNGVLKLQIPLEGEATRVLQIESPQNPEGMDDRITMEGTPERVESRRPRECAR